MSEFEQLVHDYLKAEWEQDPVAATRLGIHDHDHLLPNKSAEAMDDWGQTLRGFLRRFEQVDPSILTRDQRLDHRWVLAVLDHAIVWHELELWRRSPNFTLQDLGTSLHSLLIGDFAPLEARLKSLLARLRAIPLFLDTARQTLQPSRIPPAWLEAGLFTAQGTSRFIAQDVPRAAEPIPTLGNEVSEACKEAARAISNFECFLRECKEAAKGNFAIGRKYFDRILQRFHMLDMDCDDLYHFGEEWINRYEQQMVQVAREIDPDENWVTVLEMVKDDHPTPEGLLQAYDDETSLARRHCLEHDLITFPEGESCVLEWTPAFMRPRAPIASPWISPAFEEGLASKWYITPIDPDAPPERQRQHIRDNSWAWIRGIAMHEIYPGHHLQIIIGKVVGTPLRKQHRSPIFCEGWGLYTEELFYETGLLAKPKFRLMQLRNALWRAVRIVVDVALHTRGMSVQEAARWLSEWARLEPRWAESQARSYTARPTYPSSYQVGFPQVLDLREKYRAQKGSRYRLRDFHDELLSYSSLPLKIVREEMLAGGKVNRGEEIQE